MIQVTIDSTKCQKCTGCYQWYPSLEFTNSIIIPEEDEKLLYEELTKIFAFICMYNALELLNY